MIGHTRVEQTKASVTDVRIHDPLTFLPLRRRQHSKAAFPVNAPPIVDQLHSLSVVADDPNHKPSSARLLALLQRSELHDLALDRLRQGLCIFDGQKLCPDAVPDEAKVTVCMMAKKASLSCACREVLIAAGHVKLSNGSETRPRRSQPYTGIKLTCRVLPEQIGAPNPERLDYQQGLHVREPARVRQHGQLILKLFGG